MPLIPLVSPSRRGLLPKQCVKIVVGNAGLNRGDYLFVASDILRLNVEKSASSGEAPAGYVIHLVLT
jgi:hypothetical protein